MNRAVPSRREEVLLTVGLLVQTLISAGTFLVAKRALAELPPITLVLWRFFLSSAVFAVILLFLGRPYLPPRRAWVPTLLLGFLVGPMNQLLFFKGLETSVPAHAALLYALTPLGVYLVALLRGRERPHPAASLGIVIAFAGVLVLLLGRGTQVLSGLFFGDVLILGAVFAWVLYTAEATGYITEHGAIRATAWSMMAGALLLTPLAPSSAHPELLRQVSSTVIWSVLYVALLTSVISYLLWYFALSRTQASKVAVFSNLQPVFTALAARVLLGDPLRWEIFVGGALVLLGVRLTQRAR